MSTDIFKQGSLIQLNTSCWTGSKNINQSQMGSIGNSEWVKGKKLLVNPEVMGPIRTTIQQARKLLARYALPFPMAGLHLVPKDSVADIDGHLELLKNEFNDKVSSFAGYYGQAREEAKTALGELFNETDYPIDILTKFRFEWRFLLLDIPGKASVLSPEIYAREKQKFQDLMAETRELAMSALREEFGEIISHMTEKVANADKPKVFRSNMVNRINEFLDGFSDRNLFNDDKLSALVDQARDLVKNLNNPYSMQYNDVLRQKVSQDFASLKASIDAAIEEMPRRRIHLDADVDRGSLPEAA